MNECCSLADCAHLYCTDCCKRHAEREILTNTHIECPHPNCRHNFEVAQCSTLLPAASFDLVKTRLTEATIPASERRYCPFPDCSVFIPVVFKSANSNSAEDTFVECHSCHRGFCLQCNIPWDRMCGICAEMRPHKDFMSTNGEFPSAVDR